MQGSSSTTSSSWAPRRAPPTSRCATGFDEGTGTAAANTGTDGTVGPATLTGTTTWNANGVDGGAVDLLGGANTNAVDLPDNVLQGATDFTTSFWVRPDVQPTNWAGLFHIGTGSGNTGGYFQIQTETRADGDTGLAATFKAPGLASPTNPEERIRATPARDLAVNAWNHVVFTRAGATGTLYLNGAQIAQRTDLTVDLAEVGANTENNWLGRNGFPDAPLDGQMDDVRLYTAALSGADVAGLYADGTALNTTTTVSVSPASPSPFEAPITVSATVKDSANANPTGTAELGSTAPARARPSRSPTARSRSRRSRCRRRPTRSRCASSRRRAGATRRPPCRTRSPGPRWARGSRSTTSSTRAPGPPRSTRAPTRPSATQVLQGNAGWVASAKYGAGVNLPGAGHVQLPNDLTFGMTTEATVSTWIRPTTLPNWTTHVQIGKDTSEFLLLQSETENGTRGFAATLRKNNGDQYRIQLPGTTDLPLNQWTHVVVTLGPSPTGGGTTGKIYFNGALQNGGTRDNIPVSIGDIGEGGTTADFLGNTSWPDPRPTEQQDDFRLYGYELNATEVSSPSTPGRPTSRRSVSRTRTRRCRTCR